MSGIPGEISVYYEGDQVVVEIGAEGYDDDPDTEYTTFTLSPEFARHLAQLLTRASMQAEGDWPT